MDKTEKADLEVGGLDRVDLQFGSDSLIIASSGGTIGHQSLENQNEHRKFECLEVMDTVEAKDKLETHEKEQLPKPTESLEPETRKFGKCNLRKSLAWDTAFFTSAGVLDPEELSSMIDGVEKSSKKLLPGIEEDICKSTDSFSTLESDSLTLESLEVDLFEDIRASIQKSSKTTITAGSSGKSLSGETETHLHTSKKVDLASQSQITEKPASKNQLHGCGRMMKQGSVSLHNKQIKPEARKRESISSLPKPSKVIGKANPISVATTKRVSLGANRFQMAKDNVTSATVAGKGASAVASKIPGLGGSRRAVPKPTPSTNSSFMGSSTASRSELTKSSSCDTTASVSSEKTGKSFLNSVRRNTDSRTVTPSSSGLVPKTPSKVALKNKTEAGKSRLSSHLMSSKLYSGASPSSSISDCSSESLSSTSTVNQRSSKLRISLESNSSCRSVDSDAGLALDLQSHCNYRNPDGCKSQVAGLHSQHMKEASTQMGIVPRSGLAKPSALRMPSPKIGFFDGVKSQVRTPSRGQSHSDSTASLLKVGSVICSSGGASNKQKMGKLQAAAMIGTVKPDTQKPYSPSPFQSPSNASAKVFSASSSKGVKNGSTRSAKFLNKSVQWSHSNTEEVGTGEIDATENALDPVLNAESGLKNKFNLAMQGSEHDVKISASDWNSCDSSLGCNIGNMSSSQKVGDNANYDQSKHKSPTQKEQTSGFYAANVDSSYPDPGAVDLSCFTQVPIHGQKEEVSTLSTHIPLSLTTSEVTADSRTPFAVKNTFSNNEELHFLTGSSIDGEEKTVNLPSLESAQKENSQ